MHYHLNVFKICLVLSLLTVLNAAGIRGKIITDDNRSVAITKVDHQREYPFKTTLEPVLGLTIKGTKGLIGIEKSAQEPLSKGKDIQLNISLSVQKQTESMLDKMKLVLDADEIMVGVMESRTGKIVALASSNRYDPSHVTKKDIEALRPKFAAYPYEPGYVVSPIVLALALEHGVVTPDTVLNTFNGRMQIGEKRYITDDEKFELLTATDVIVHSSNIGISQISWKLTGKEFRDGLTKFGFDRPSEIDLDEDLPGHIKSLHLLNNRMHRANVSYGYGMLATFTQLLKAYAVFNNGGNEVIPQIIKRSNDNYSSKHKKVISMETAQQIHNVLIEVVKRGTGVNAQYPGLEIGGKTGTAHMARNGRYVSEYHSSFYGFANDNEGHAYTIGVLVIRAKTHNKYYASQSAVPTFKNIVQVLVNEGMLTPK